MVKKINPTSEITFICKSQSFQMTPGEIVSMVMTEDYKVHLISFDQANNTIATIRNYGDW